MQAYVKKIRGEILKDFLRQRKELFSQGASAPPPNIVLGGENFLTVGAAAERAQKTEVSILNWVHRGIGGLKLYTIEVQWHSKMYYIKEASFNCVIERLSTAVPVPMQMRLIPEAHLILRHGEKEDSVLLMRSWNPRCEKRMYDLVSGQVKSNEEFFHAIIRITMERIHIILNAEILELIHIMQRNEQPQPGCLDVFFTLKQGTTWLGELRNTRPGKYDGPKWVPLNALPDNTLPHIRTALAYCRNGVPFSSYGWKD